MNGNLFKVVAVGTGIVISISSGWIANTSSRGERLAIVETKIEYIEDTVGKTDAKVQRLIDSLL